MNNKNGFTLVEIIVVLVVLSILAGVGIPTYLKYIDDSREKVCKVTRTSLLNYYKNYSILNEDSPTLEDVVNSNGSILPRQFSQDVESFKCPDGGNFYVEESIIKCTKHDGEVVIGEPNDSGDNGSNDNGGNNNSGNDNGSGNEEPIITVVDLINPLAGNWLELCNNVLSTGKAKDITLGDVYKFGNQLFVANKSDKLTTKDARDYINNISSFKTMTYLDPNSPVFGPTNVDKVNNVWNVILNDGSIYQEIGKIYMYRGPNNQTRKPEPPSGNWVELEYTK